MSDIWHTWEDKPYRDATIIVEGDDSSLCICMYMVEDKCEYEKSNKWCYLYDYFKDYNSIKQKLQKAKEDIETKQNTISDFIRTTFEKVTEYETKLFNKDKEIAELKEIGEKDHNYLRRFQKTLIEWKDKNNGLEEKITKYEEALKRLSKFILPEDFDEYDRMYIDFEFDRGCMIEIARDALADKGGA